MTARPSRGNRPHEVAFFSAAVACAAVAPWVAADIAPAGALILDAVVFLVAWLLSLAWRCG